MKVITALWGIRILAKSCKWNNHQHLSTGAALFQKNVKFIKLYGQGKVNAPFSDILVQIYWQNFGEYCFGDVCAIFWELYSGWSD